MHRLTLPPTRTKDWWVQVCQSVFWDYLERAGAVVWPEAEAVLGETPWVHNEYAATFPPHWRLDPIHLANARDRSRGFAIAETATLGGHPVTAYLYGPALRTYGRQTAVRRLAATKRRLYRRLLQWVSQPALCGDVGEAVTDATLRALRGYRVWLPPSYRIGHVDTLLGRSLPEGGPLDATGFWPSDPENPTSPGWVPFAVEVKNVRGTVYPWDVEVWDLLGKLGTYPDVLPVLVARRIHKMTFNMFKDLGAIGVNVHDQLFSTRIDPADFARVRDGLSIMRMRQTEGQEPVAALVKFFGETGPTYGTEFLARWQASASIVHDHRLLRDQHLSAKDRRRLWRSFTSAMKTAGLRNTRGWAPSGFGFVEDNYDDAYEDDERGETHNEDDREFEYEVDDDGGPD